MCYQAVHNSLILVKWHNIYAVECSLRSGHLSEKPCNVRKINSSQKNVRELSNKNLVRESCLLLTSYFWAALAFSSMLRATCVAHSKDSAA